MRSSSSPQTTTEPESDEHIIRCSICGRNLIIKDNVNNGVAFLSHLKIDHGIFYNAQQMTETKTRKKVAAANATVLLSERNPKQD